ELASAQQRCTFGTKVEAAKDAPKFGAKGPMFLPTTRTCFAFSPDGRLFAQYGPDAIIKIGDIVTGKELTQFKGHAEAVNAVTFAPAGKTVASASTDSTALIWDVSKLARCALEPKALQSNDLQECWKALGESDAAKACANMCELAA